MKKLLFTLCVIIAAKNAFSQTDYSTVVVFPAGYQVGDYIEFVGVHPDGVGASGYYEISIVYTRNGVAAGATHLASITHANPALWREAGRINNNTYVSPGRFNFTIDGNTEYGNARFRIRAINTWGDTSSPLGVQIKVRSISFNSSWTALSNTGNDLTVTKFLPMTNDWSLYVGNSFTSDGASIALKAIENGNVGIGTETPSEKLSVNGKIRAKEVKVEAAPWPDYVFQEGYKLEGLEGLERFIKENRHLPEIPSAAEVKETGVELGDMNARLLKKIEELTLYMIELKKNNDLIQMENKKQQQEIDRLKSKF